MAVALQSGFWELVFGAIALKSQVFRAIETLPQGNIIALNVLLLAGLSQALGQIIVLFVNRVKLLRFILSLLISALLFVFSYGFWIECVWLSSRLLFDIHVSQIVVYRSLGLAASPFLFSFLIALPYFGIPIQFLLSLWSLLAFVQGFATSIQINGWEAFWCGIGGWLVLQIMQRTIGKPIAACGRWLSNTAAGKNMVTDMRQLEQLLQTKFQLGSGIQQINSASGRAGN